MLIFKEFRAIRHAKLVKVGYTCKLSATGEGRLSTNLMDTKIDVTSTCDAEINIYKSVNATRSNKRIIIQDFLDFVKNGEYKKVAAHVHEFARTIPRNKDEQTDEEKEELQRRKKVAPVVTVSGTFTRRKDEHLDQHSGFICPDFDSIEPEKYDEVRAALVKDPYTFALFDSISGMQRLAVIVKIPIERHRDSFFALEKYYRDKYGLEIDPACKDVSRARYVSYDVSSNCLQRYLTFCKKKSRKKPEFT
ncbi:MAG: hypothetical protein GY797_31115 [Deltaproteobacteria bacterium]|nr:hypothetical protein [Deltaproteobacteria bacterium]